VIVCNFSLLSKGGKAIEAGAPSPEAAKERAMPHVVVKLWPGKSERQKAQLAKTIVRDVVDILGYGEDSVSVAIEEIESGKDWREKVYQPDILDKQETLYQKTWLFDVAPGAGRTLRKEPIGFRPRIPERSAARRSVEWLERWATSSIKQSNKYQGVKVMQGTILYGPRDVRFEKRDDPKIIAPTDAIIKIAATCVCGSDLWPYRGIQATTEPTPMGHEYCGIVEEVGSAVTSVKPGQFVIGSFFASDNTCPHCRFGYQTSCQQVEFVGGAQAEYLRVPLADGTLVATPEVPADDLIPNLLATSDVLGTGWFAAEAANVKPGSTVVVVGDGAVGLLGVLSAKQMGAGRIIAMSRHETRQKLAREFGATDIVAERGDEGAARIKELTDGIGADSVLECVGTQESMKQAISSARPGGFVGFVGMPHGVELNGQELFFTHVHLHGGPAPVRRFLPELIDLVWDGRINPGKVFDLTLPLSQVAEGYRAMDERRAIKTLLLP
jgi:threonine dehydrogenase-like Zn-dependent dehydrogenase/phenylpyruvate tautomerase PptA (4-oxalocrotonate tautomerase family)